MLSGTIQKLEAAIKSLPVSDAKKKEGLLELLVKLKSEVTELSKTNVNQALSVAGFAELAAHEATRTDRSPNLLSLALEGLSSSVIDFEKSHPSLVGTVNEICKLLSNIGI